MQIDIYQDTACPWCRVGKRNLKTALASWTGEAVTTVYHPFFLNPDIPPEGYAFLPYMKAKGGGRVLPEQWFDGPREAGRRAGVIFNFEQMERAPNTLLSHELIALTPETQREAVMDAVYAAYFEHGQDIGSLEVLVEIAQENGLDADLLRKQLENHEAREQVLAEAAHAAELGISGVPFFIINKRYAFSGAQPPDAIIRVLQQVVSLEKQGEVNS